MSRHRGRRGRTSKPLLSATMASTDTLWFAFLSEEKSAVRLRSRADLEAASRKVDVVFCGGEWKPIETVLEEATAPPTPRPGSASGVAATAGTPRNFTQHVSVKYDPLTGGLTGLPKAWEGLLPEGCSRDAVSYADVPAELRPTGVADPGLRLKDELLVGAPFNVQKWRPSFGVPVELVETTPMHGFSIPTVLLTLRTALAEAGGLAEEGIFRVAPDGAKCAEAERQLGDAPLAVPAAAAGEAHVLANLIKRWFRQLPMRLFDVVPSERRVACSTGAECLALLQSDAFPPLQKGITLWLLELMSDVVDNGEENKMSLDAIAIVLSPNLYTPLAEGADPYEALHHAKVMAHFVVELLSAFTSTRNQWRSNSDGLAASEEAAEAA